MKSTSDVEVRIALAPAVHDQVAALAKARNLPYEEALTFVIACGLRMLRHSR